MNVQRYTYTLQNRPAGVSAYDDFGLRAQDFSYTHRCENAQRAMQRFFVGKAELPDLEREAVMRSLNPAADFSERLREAEVMAEGGFGPELLPPSGLVESAFRDYALSELVRSVWRDYWPGMNNIFNGAGAQNAVLLPKPVSMLMARDCGVPFAWQAMVMTPIP